MIVKERNKQIKKALLKQFKPSQVSVKGETGTAYGWVTVKITLDPPPLCQCKWERETATWAKVPYDYMIRLPRQEWTGQLGTDRYMYVCPSCCEKIEHYEKIAKDIVYGCGAEFYHYYADDGYNTEHAECIVIVETKERSIV